MKSNQAKYRISTMCRTLGVSTSGYYAWLVRTPVIRLSEFAEQYARRPESKAADQTGNPAGENTKGILQRLEVRPVHLARIGKDVDRLHEEDGATLTDGSPIEYDSGIEGDVAFSPRFRSSG